MYEYFHTIDKAPNMLCRLCDIETILTLAGLLPMLEEMNHLVKKSQERAMYIAKYDKLRKRTCMTLNNLYQLEQTCLDVKFASS